MDLFVQTALSFPVVLLSFLLCLAILFWCVAALGIVDSDVLDADLDLDGLPDGDGLPTEGLAGLLLKFGLNGVPVTLVLTLLFFFGWLFCYFAELLVFRFLPLGVLRYPLGLIVLIGTLLLAIPVARVFIRPLRPLFRKLEATTSKSVLGQIAMVRSGWVSPTFGEAALEDGGAGLLLRIRADESLQLKRGDRVVLLEYLEHEHAYRVITEDEFKGI